MANPMFEKLIGVIDGLNKVFRFSRAYTPGSTAIYINGQLVLAKAFSEWSESDPSTGEITLTRTLRTRDTVSGFAMDTLVQVGTTIVPVQTVITGSVLQSSVLGLVQDNNVIGVVKCQ